MITNLTVAEESFASLTKYQSESQTNLRWDLVFTLPAWLRVWWQCFGEGAELFIRSVKQDNRILGIAPLQIRDSQASIIGGINTCDYLDFITVPGCERDFFNILLDDLQQSGVKSLHLETVRPDSSIIRDLLPLVRERQLPADCQQVDVSLDMILPEDWEEYLATLNKKQRHEVRRKMRNLQEAGEISYRVVEDKNDLIQATHTFLQLFPDYRSDKAEFMTPEMQVYFHNLAESLAEAGVLRYGVLELGRRTAAMVMYFDFLDNIFLYNSAYDPDYKSLSVGIVSKARCICDCIEKKKNRFDFLKGNEQYKYYLGGKEIPLYCCHITLL